MSPKSRDFISTLENGERGTCPSHFRSPFVASTDEPLCLWRCTAKTVFRSHRARCIKKIHTLQRLDGGATGFPVAALHRCYCCCCCDTPMHAERRHWCEPKWFVQFSCVGQRVFGLFIVIPHSTFYLNDQAHNSKQAHDRSSSAVVTRGLIVSAFSLLYFRA